MHAYCTHSHILYTLMVKTTRACGTKHNHKNALLYMQIKNEMSSSD